MTIRALLNKKTVKAAEMYIYAEIDSYYGIGAQSVADAIKEIGAVEQLDVYFNSPGGSVFEGIAIYNQFVRVKANKTFHVDALAASIASVILMAGDEIVIADGVGDLDLPRKALEPEDVPAEADRVLRVPGERRGRLARSSSAAGGPALLPEALDRRLRPLDLRQRFQH